MRQFTTRLTAAMLLVSIFVTPAFALNGVVDAKDGVRMRAEASTDSEALASLPDGAEVKILESMTGWYKVSHGGKTGYIASDYVTKDGEDAKSAASGKSAQTATGTVKAENGVRMRAEASTDSEALASLPNGAVVKILESMDGWYKVSDGGQTGYVSSDYITKNGESNGTAGTAKDDKSNETASPAKDDKGGETASSAKDSKSDQKATTILTGVVKADGGVRMRAEANTDSTVLKNLADGTQVEILETLTDWYKVSHKGQTGYVSKDFLVEGEKGTYVQVANGPLNVRAQANADSEKVGSLSNGKVVKVDGLVNGWYKTEEGYISAEYVVPCDSLDREGSAAYVKVEEGPLNIRTEPDAGSKKVSTLAAGQVVEVKGLTNGWYKIEEGYISADYVAQSSSAEAKAQAQSSAAKSQQSSSSSQKSGGSTGASAPAAPQGSGTGQSIASYACQFVGYPYVYGGTSPKGFDCSGFTSYIYRQFGYSINRTASAQLNNGWSVSRGELQPGDLVMFKKGGSSKRASHVGIYIGGNQFVHASTSRTGVIISSMNSAYYSSGFVGGRRIVG